MKKDKKISWKFILFGSLDILFINFFMEETTETTHKILYLTIIFVLLLMIILSFLIKRCPNCGHITSSLSHNKCCSKCGTKKIKYSIGTRMKILEALIQFILIEAILSIYFYYKENRLMTYIMIEAMPITLVLLIIIYFVIWRCPKCRRFLRTINCKEHCPHCHTSFFE